MFSRIALLIYFRRFSFTFTTWLTVWCKRPTFQPILAFDLPSSLSFSFEVRDMQYSLPLEHFEATAGLLIGLLSILLCLSEHSKALAEGNRQGIVSGAVNTPTTFIKFAAVSVL